jgi:hypothetical protein
MLLVVLKQRVDMLFAHAGHNHAELCCSTAALAVAVLALALSVVAIVIALKKSKKK